MALLDGVKELVTSLVEGFGTGAEEESPEPAFVFGANEGIGGFDGNAATKAEDIDTIYPRQQQRSFTKASSNVAVMPNTYKAGEVAVVEPRSFSEAAQIIKRLLDSKTVVVNLDLLDGLQSQRTIDFVSGATHALSGSSQKISDKVFIFTPSSIALSVENAASQNKFSEALWNKPL